MPCSLKSKARSPESSFDSRPFARVRIVLEFWSAEFIPLDGSLAILSQILALRSTPISGETLQAACTRGERDVFERAAEFKSFFPRPPCDPSKPRLASTPLSRLKRRNCLGNSPMQKSGSRPVTHACVFVLWWMLPCRDASDVRSPMEHCVQT